MRIVINHNDDKMFINGDESHYDSGTEYRIKNPKQVEEVLEIVLEALEVEHEAPMQLISINEETVRTVYES